MDVGIASPRSEDHTDKDPTQGIVPNHDLSTSNDDDLRFGVRISVRISPPRYANGIRATFIHLKSVTNHLVTNLTESA
jgi:hypothetical protein